MSELNRGRSLLVLAIGASVLAFGFFVGRTIGTGEDDAVGGSIPTRTTTQRVPVEIPTLGVAERIPTLEETRQSSPPAETETDEGGSFSPTVEPEPPASEPSAPEQSSPPEVTVAPNG